MAKGRPGKRERNGLRLATAHRAQQVIDNLSQSLAGVERESMTPSPFDPSYLKSKGARGGGSPYGRTERFERRTTDGIGLPLFDQIQDAKRHEKRKDRNGLPKRPKLG